MLEAAANDQQGASHMIIPIAWGNPWGTVKELATGYNRRAQEREERVTAESMSRTLGDGKGGFWLHREGDRLRIVARPSADPNADLQPRLDQAIQILQLEDGK